MLSYLRVIISFYLLLVCGNTNSQTLVIAHRGASAYEPENTLAAFEKAIEMKADYIETDVHQTKDSVLVLMHDMSFNRTCEFRTPVKLMSNLIKDLTYKQFLQLKIKNKDYGPPTLDTAIKTD
jgi:glycerophosphoryl diester phosphodiesterase